MTAAITCRTCGTPPSEGARFCHGCGAPVLAQRGSAEYKQVTILVADVVRSTRIAALVGPERLREIMAELANRCAEVVRRYGGTVDKFTGDGIVALFGAPTALEDHAIRGCLAALDIQDGIGGLATVVKERDGVDLQLRVGLNSGQVIAGDIGNGASGYTAFGDQVGVAQQMESAAAPGAVMLSASTARLVEDVATLGDAETGQTAGAERQVAGRRLLSIAERRSPTRAESTLVGRRWELAAIEGLLDRAIDGYGTVVQMAGPPGIGKSRLVREVAAMANRREVEVFVAFCESHGTDMAFRVFAQLLGAATGVHGLDAPAARNRVRSRHPDADAEDLLLLDDLLGIVEPGVERPQIDPDARRRRLAALVNAAALARQIPTIYVVEDAHWIDEASESMLAAFASVIPQTHSLMLITYRPEYRGALRQVGGAQIINVAPLRDSETATLVAELLGGDPSVAELCQKVADRADGNPFFAEEMVRDLAERGVLRGARCAYECSTAAGEVGVPATLQATIAARIDRLDPPAKQTLSAAAVIGSPFGGDILETLGVAPLFEDLVNAEFIDQIPSSEQPEYVFRHPLICAVAYESQLKADRAQMHRRVAAAIEARDSAKVEENAALIAEHMEAAGDAHAAYGWHMRAATWVNYRDITAARLSWERAKKIADNLAADDPGRPSMRIAPRMMLAGTAVRVYASVAGDRFDELRQLCDAAGDKTSIAVATAGLVTEHLYRDRLADASRTASEAMDLIESIGDPTLTVGLGTMAIYGKTQCAEFSDVLNWSQRVIDLADGDSSKGNLLIGSPLPFAFAQRGVGRFWMGLPGWREDLRSGATMARGIISPMFYGVVIGYIYCVAVPNGVLHPDDDVVGELEEALRIAERSGGDFTLAVAQMTLGVALVHRQQGADRERGAALLTTVSEVFASRGHQLCDLPLVTVYAARERARLGELDEAMSIIRTAVDHVFRNGRLLLWGVATTGVLVETLLERGAEGDLSEAHAAVERLAAAAADDGLALRDIWLLRLRALLARARDDDAGYRVHRDRYRDAASSLGFEGHDMWAETMR